MNSHSLRLDPALSCGGFSQLRPKARSIHSLTDSRRQPLKVVSVLAPPPGESSRQKEASGSSLIATSPSGRTSVVYTGPREIVSLPDVHKPQEPQHSTVKSNPQVNFPLHVHFGAGKLGLGLVVPALEQSNTRYVILQRPSQDWEDVASGDSESISLLINGEDVVEGGLKIIRQSDIDLAASEGRTLADIVSESREGQGHLVLSSDRDVSAALASCATSFSCALGAALPKVVGPLLSKLPRRFKSARPTLYACENDLDSVRVLAEELESHVNVVPCMVDRICSSREVVAGDAAAIHVEAEEHSGSIVLLEQTEQGEGEIPLDGDTVQVPESEEVADYLFIQKKRLVNSMHTVLAFSTLVDHDANNTSLFSWEHALPHLPLLNYSEAKPELKEMIWAWAVAQILVLMKEKGVDVMTEAHQSESDEELVRQMLDVAKQTLERFSSIEDTTSRVLGGGVSNRYNTRLVPVQQGMQLVSAMVSDLPADCIQNKVLSAAGMDIDSIVAACDTLVEDASKFAELDEQEMAFREEWNALTKGVRDVLKGFPAILGAAVAIMADLIATGPFASS